MEARVLICFTIGTLCVLLVSSLFLFADNCSQTFRREAFISPNSAIKAMNPHRTASLTPIGWRDSNSGIGVSRDLVYYNRVPKAGSSTMKYLIRLLAEASLSLHQPSRLAFGLCFVLQHNKFTYLHDTQYWTWKSHLSKGAQEKHVQNLQQYPSRPILYNRILYFMDFQ